MNLYQINEQILNCIDLETGEIVDFEHLDSLQMELDTKLENIALWIKNLDAEAVALKAEKQAFEARQKAAENKAKSLKKYLTDFLHGSAFKTTRVSVSFRKSKSLEISEEAIVPEEFLTPQLPKVDKVGLKKAIEAGNEYEGIQIVENQNISIK